MSNKFNYDKIITRLFKEVDDYMTALDVKKIRKAYELAEYGHKGQKRKSGEPYICHPLEVAIVLAQLKLDVDSICSALLHDCIEDTKISKDEINKYFGKKVADIVDGVTKLDNISYNSDIETQADNFRKLFLAMSADVRVILIKLADRLHNIRTISAMPRHKQIRISKETLELHAPIAHRLGLNAIKAELEDLSFQNLHPYRYKVISKYINKNILVKDDFINNTTKLIKNRLKEDEINIDIKGRTKDVYSIFSKMRNNNLKIREIFDVYAFRMVVNGIDDCYRALGSVHNLYKPLPGKFKDYIALPKKNGYQSLHTVLYSPEGVLIEVQIRSKDMDFIAEKGVAAHWLYKKDDKTANYWLKSLDDIQKQTNTTVEFLEEVKLDLFPDEVFVFTPKGRIVQLPYKATVVDFAYAVHTEVGNHCIAAKINKKSIFLYQQLVSGQTIEIITKESATPKTHWLSFVNTSKARLAIKEKLKSHSHNQLIITGKKLLESALLNEGFTLSSISSKEWQQCLLYLSACDNNEIFLKIGLGEILIPIVINLLIGEETSYKISNISIKNIQNSSISCANCCHPLPGDKIIGAMSQEKGLVVHNSQCKNLDYVIENNPQWLELEWGDNNELFSSVIQFNVQNRRGVLASIANVISKINVNIENVVINEEKNTLKSLTFTLLLKDKNHLKEVCTEVKKLKYVKSVSRP